MNWYFSNLLQIQINPLHKLLVENSIRPTQFGEPTSFYFLLGDYLIVQSALASSFCWWAKLHCARFSYYPMNDCKIRKCNYLSNRNWDLLERKDDNLNSLHNSFTKISTIEIWFPKNPCDWNCPSSKITLRFITRVNIVPIPCARFALLAFAHVTEYM